MTTEFDTLRDLLSSNSDIASMDPEKAAATAAKRQAALDKMDATMEVSAHVTSIIKGRTFAITGDTSHLSVKHILGQGANIDKPRKYDFQSENVNEEEFIRSIGNMLPVGLFNSSNNTAEELRAAIPGTCTVTLAGSRDTKCYDCAKPMRLTVSGNNLHPDCEVACENNSEFFVDIDFPTGEVVFGDWPDRFSEIRDEGFLDECDDGESINYIKGQRQRSEGFAKQGIFHLSVGNSSPTWYYNEATNAIIIGSEGYDEENDEHIVPEGFKGMGYFCTDLWWVTMLDMSRYEEMLSKLPGERGKKYYKKDVETANIKPGRYRFYSVPRKMGDDDDYSSMYAKAEYLGPCGEIPKVKSVAEGKAILTPRQMVIQSAKRYPGLYAGQFEEVRFGVMDQIFNVLGNGIRSKGEFLSHISVPAGTAISDEMPPETAEKPKHMKDYIRSPYPNFKKQYSLLGDVPIDAIPTEWLEEMVWFYDKSREFFLSDKVSNYSYAYPSKNTAGNDIKSWTESLAKRRKEGQTDEEFNAAVTKDYECEYHGDLEDFLTRKWAKELKRIMDFIDETQKTLNKELTKRNRKR